jgi:hypothetical protein
MSTVQELRVVEEGSGEIGDVEHRLKQIRSFEMRAGEISSGTASRAVTINPYGPGTNHLATRPTKTR